MSDNQSTPEAPDATTDTEAQPQLQFGAIRVDPLTNEPIVSTEEDWSCGSAMVVAETLGGELYARAVSPWVRICSPMPMPTQVSMALALGRTTTTARRATVVKRNRRPRTASTPSPTVPRGKLCLSGLRLACVHQGSLNSLKKAVNHGEDAARVPDRRVAFLSVLVEASSQRRPRSDTRRARQPRGQPVH